MSVLAQIAEAVINGDEVATPKLIEQGLAAGTPVKDLLHEGLLKGMTEVGRRFREGEYFVPEVLIAAEAMKAGTTLLKPHLAKAGVKPEATAVIGTVRGDLHDIGKNLVVAMLEGGGYEVIDLGVNVSPEQFTAAVKQKNPRILAMSALLTTTMPAMKTTVEALKQAGVRDQVKILVGGAPITQKYADEIGADGYSETAAGVVGIAKRALN